MLMLLAAQEEDSCQFKLKLLGHSLLLEPPLQPGSIWCVAAAESGTLRLSGVLSHDLHWRDSAHLKKWGLAGKFR